MLIVISNCSYSELSGSNDKLSAFSNIIYSHKNRDNLVFIDKELMNDVLQDENKLFGRDISSTLYDISSTRREYGGFKNKLHIFFVADFNEENISSTNFIDNSISLSYRHYIDSIFNRPVSLLCENTRDCDFYKLVAKSYSKYFSNIRSHVKFDGVNGGGSQTKFEFDRIVNIKRPVIGVVDSDKTHPHKGEGSTSGAFGSDDKKLSNNTGFVYVVNVTEVECLVPLSSIYETINKNMPDKQEFIDDMDNIVAQGDFYRGYFDHKNGLSLKQVIQLDQKYGNYWAEGVAKIARFTTKPCFSTKVCTDCDSCPSVIGLGNKIFDHVLSDLQVTHFKRFWDVVSPSIRKEWERIGSHMQSWGVSGVVPSSRSS